MAQVTVAIGFHFRNILLDRAAVRWTQGQVLSFSMSLRSPRLPLTDFADEYYE
jgi:hypothetical protein